MGETSLYQDPGGIAHGRGPGTSAPAHRWGWLRDLVCQTHRARRCASPMKCLSEPMFPAESPEPPFQKRPGDEPTLHWGSGPAFRGRGQSCCVLRVPIPGTLGWDAALGDPGPVLDAGVLGALREPAVGAVMVCVPVHPRSCLL